jgi:hypothetical protein
MAMTTNHINGEASCTSARQFYIASRDGNSNNNVAAATTFVIRQPLVHPQRVA